MHDLMWSAIKRSKLILFIAVRVGKQSQDSSEIKVSVREVRDDEQRLEGGEGTTHDKGKRTRGKWLVRTESILEHRTMAVCGCDNLTR
ncbi:unnamed protein product [Ectocarpus sp. 6 AP-2014]